MLVFLHDPATIQELPQMPDGFLALMGISAGGYLGGKLLRKPGPKIDKVVVTPQGNLLNVEVYGGVLAQLATSFQIDGQEVAPDKLRNLNQRPEIITPDDTPKEAGYARTLKLTLADPPAKWLEGGEHRFTITNPDAQSAAQIYRLEPTILNVAAPNAPGQPIIVTGYGFSPQSKVQYIVPNAQPQDMQVQIPDATHLHITVLRGQTGAVTLRITNPAGQRIDFNVALP